MRFVRVFVVILAVALLIGGGFAGGYVAGEYHVFGAGVETPGYALLWQVRDLLNRTFLGEIPSQQAQVYGAAHGLTNAFQDPYTVFVEPAPRTFERDAIRGHFGGIGATMARNEANEIVLTVMREKPAARAGIKDGDVLAAVDGKPITAEMSIEQVVLLVRGNEGTKVTLTLRRPGQVEPFSVAVTRERIETPSVEWRMLDAGQGIGYLRIGIFGEGTSQELKQGLDELAGQHTDKLVLDLRGNGGGLLDAAVDVASQFLTEGVVLREQKRDNPETFYPVKTVKSPAQAWEVVLLVDAGTASASEIVAGALRDAGRAVLIGEKTYGKGSVQEVHDLPDGSSLHVTVARWFTPNHVQIDTTGLTPDVTVNIAQADRDAGRDPQLARGLGWLQGER
ncbi:MAG: S41 family peptidase [Chloroflexi bacterium]|nr:S41 family peptidase [Chloroflexota bacterium]